MSPTTRQHPPVDQAGAIVFRVDDAQPRVLLVRSRKEPNKWIFPKGHVERGEPVADAALREAKEEAGVDGELLGDVGVPLEFPSGDEHVRVQYYLVRMRREGESPEGREKVWLAPHEALTRLGFEDARELLRAALPAIESVARQRRRRAAGGAGSAGGVGPVGDDAFHDFLIAEYEHIAESLLRNEEDGERRVTFLIALATGVGAVLGFLIGGERPLLPPERTALVAAALVVLLSLGFLTFTRVVSRNSASDRYKRRLARIRRYYVLHPEHERVSYVPYDPYRVEARRLASWRRAGRGGWLETVAAVEALLAGILAGVLLFDLMRARSSAWWVYVATSAGALLTGAVAWYRLVSLGRSRYRSEMWDDAAGFVIERQAFRGPEHGEEQSLQADGKAAHRARRMLGRAGFEPDATVVTIPAHEVGGPQSHETNTLVLVLTGLPTVIDEQSRERADLRRGDALFIPAGRAYRIRAGDSATTCLTGHRAG